MGGATQWNGRGGERLPRTLEALEEGRRRGWHRGAQGSVSRDLGTLADLAAGEVRDGAALTPDHLAVALGFHGLPGGDAHRQRTRRVIDALYEDLDLVMEDPR